MAQILRQGAGAYIREYAGGGACDLVQSVLAKLSLCRTPALGADQYTCDRCGQTVSVHHSCGDRHCPICSGRKRYDFAQRAEALLLEGVTYYQVVFTLPGVLSELALANRTKLTSLLYDSAWKALRQTLLTEQDFDPAAMMVLHTWNQQLDAHWHVHALVPGGGPRCSAPEGWKDAEPPEGAANSHGYYLVDVDALRESFRTFALAQLGRLHRRGQLRLGGKFAYLQDATQWDTFLAELAAVDWVSYVQPPPSDTCTAEHVVRYLTRYLTGGPISDQRIVAADRQHVTFLAREGRVTGGERKQVPLTLTTTEFIRRWCQHIQPPQLTKTRYFGGWCSRLRTRYLEYCQEMRGSTDFDPAEFEVAEDFIDPELEAAAGSTNASTNASTGESGVGGGASTIDEESIAPWCPHCERVRMRWTGTISKPSWREVLDHRDSRCPSWYAEQGYAAWVRFLDEEYGIDEETYYEAMGIESAIEQDSSTSSQPSQVRPNLADYQRYLPGLQPEWEDLLHFS